MRRLDLTGSCAALSCEEALSGLSKAMLSEFIVKF